jgi:hypothetical protein
MGQFSLYFSTDPGAPVLSGTSGALTTLLDYVLVTGEGWTIEYTAASKRVYRAPSGNRLYYRIADDDADPTQATLNAYVTMSDIDTGTGSFGGFYIAKSNAASVAARDWMCFADDRTCCLYTEWIPAHTFYNSTGFGDFYSLMATDSYNSFCCGRTSTMLLDPSGTSEKFGRITRVPSTAGSFNLARSFSQIGSVVDAAMHGDYLYNSTTSFAGTLLFPNIDESVMLSRLWVHEPASAGIRGYVRGLWVPLHAAASFADGSTASGTAELLTRTFRTIKGVFGGSGSVGVKFLETSNTVETNA